MLFERFLSTINRIWPGDPIAGRGAALAALNPEKFYIENVRSLLNVSATTAVDVCEAAVRQGFFRRRIDVLCPDGVVGASAESPAQLPEVVHCWFVHDGGPPEERYIPTRELETVVAYSLNDSAAARV